MDYTAIAAQIARGDTRVVELRASSLVMLLNGLSVIEGKGAWKTYPTASQWDDIQEWLANAAYDILEIYECEECEECEECSVREIDIFDDFKTINTAGQTFLGAGNHVRDLTDEHSMNAGNVTLDDSHMIAAPGRYLVMGWASSDSIGRNRLHLYDWYGGTAVIIGENAKDNTQPHFEGMIDVEEETDFIMMHRTLESGLGGKVINQNYSEHYAHCRWERLGDVPD